MARKPTTQLIAETANAETMAAGVKAVLAPAMVNSQSDLAVMDCVTLNHTPAVVAAFEESKIDVYPSAGHPLKAGYPPYSHDCSILDGGMFRPFQAEISRIYRDFKPNPDRSSMCLLMDAIGELWRSEKYRTMATQCFERYGDILSTIVEKDGHHK